MKREWTYTVGRVKVKIREDTRAWAEPSIAALFTVFEPYDIAKAKRFYGKGSFILYIQETEYDIDYAVYNVPPQTTLTEEMANLVYKEIVNEATLYDGNYFIDVEINDYDVILSLLKKLEKRE